MDKSPKIKLLYSLLYFIMDVESLQWDLADFLIKPTALFRGFLVRKIALKLGINDKQNSQETTEKSEKQEST